MASEWMLLREVQELTRAASISTVRHWIATGRLPSVKPGRRRLVRRSDVERFLMSGAGSPPESPRTRALETTRGGGDENA